MAQGVDPQVVMFQTIAKHSAVEGNGGTAAGLVGRYDAVAARIAAFAEAGIETFMLHAQELDRFAEEIMPRVHFLQSVTGKII